MQITLFVLIGIAVFGMLGYERGLFKILCAFLSFLLAAALAKPLSLPLAALAAKSHLVPLTLAPLAALLAAGLILFGLLAGCSTLLLNRFEAWRERSDRARVALWERLGGAALGLTWGGFLVALVLTGIHVIGAVEEALDVPAEAAPAKAGAPASAASARRAPTASGKVRTPVQAPQPPPPDPAFVALKKKIEASAFGAWVKKADPVGDSAAETCRNLTLVVNTPSLYSVFLRHPSITRLTDDPRVRALSEDGQIRQQLSDKRYADLLNNGQIAALLGDRAFLAELKATDIKAVLREVLGDSPDATSAAPAAAPAAPCDRCIGSNGQGKDAYRTEVEAARRAALLRKETGDTFFAYACPYKNGWHLTKKKNGP
jgi:uncharacterized membrane protein required for colicin V production